VITPSGTGPTPRLADQQDDVRRRVVALACRAPSVHNTQPWQWRVTGSRIRLRADRSRQLRASDPQGRNLMISLGAALHHARVAAAALGRAPRVTRFPDPRDPDLVAEVDLAEARVPFAEELELAAAIEKRRTDRRRFTSWPVPPERLAVLAGVAESTGASVLPVDDAGDRAAVERLVGRAIEAEDEDPLLREEQRHWVEHGPDDGVPRTALPAHERATERPDRFDRDGSYDLNSFSVDVSDAVLALCTEGDGPADWLDAGEALSAVWLRATVGGLSVVPLSQVVEVTETRAALQHDVLAGTGVPQLLLRIGWQEVYRPELPATPRRPLDEVLRT
jgi:hypothetical protein